MPRQSTDTECALPALPPLERYNGSADEEWFRQCMDIEEARWEGIRPALPKRWHAALTTLKASVEAPASKTFPYPHQQLVTWDFSTPGRLHRGRASPLRTARETAKRGLAFADAIFRAADARGIQASIDEDEGRFCLRLHGAEAHFAVREGFDKQMVRVAGGGMSSTEVPDGRLTVFIYYWNGFQFSKYRESETMPLESHSIKVFRRLYENVLRVRQEERQKMAQHEAHLARQAAVERVRQEREAREAAEAAIRQRQEAEAARERAAFEEAKRWKEASLLREYVTQARQLRGQEWCEWASALADRHDPLTADRVPKVLTQALTGSTAK